MTVEELIDQLNKLVDDGYAKSLVFFGDEDGVVEIGSCALQDDEEFPGDKLVVLYERF